MAKTTRPETAIDDTLANPAANPAADSAGGAETVPEPVVIPEPGTSEAERVSDMKAPDTPEPDTERQGVTSGATDWPRQEAPKRSSGFLGLVAGGVVAAALGYGLSYYLPFNDWTGQISQTDVELKGLTERLNALESAPAPVAAVDSALADRVQALEQATPEPSDLSAVTDSIAAIEARISTLESKPQTGGGTTLPTDVMAEIETLKADVKALKGSGSAVSAQIEAAAADATARLAEAEAQAAKLTADAEETARKAMARAAVSRLQASLESGAPYASSLADLSELEVPAVLSDSAETGIPSQSALVEAFPDAARSALEASLQADMGESGWERLGSLLQSTTGARSLTPREGSDPDAVLSRAEAAVKAGDLNEALGELQGLPPEGQAAMEGFIAMAQQRLAAEKAVADLSTAIEG